jgi:hypothetical protein
VVVVPAVPLPVPVPPVPAADPPVPPLPGADEEHEETRISANPAATGKVRLDAILGKVG